MNIETNTLNQQSEQEMLKKCSEEPIHLINTVQSYAALIAIDQEWHITHASENCETIIGTEPAKILGTHIKTALGPEITHAVRGAYQNFLATGTPDRLFERKLPETTHSADLSVYGNETSIIIEIEKHDDQKIQASVGTVKTLKAYLMNINDQQSLMDTAARLLKAMTGYHRVMVYRFLPDGCGEVISEYREEFMESYKGLRFPASDIPEQARILYTRNLLRQINDVDSKAIRILSGSETPSAPLDLSLSGCRSVSQVHLEYLRNMQVCSSLSVSIIIQGKLWGLFALHHRTPRELSLSARTSLELFADIFALEVSHQSELDTSRRKASKVSALTATLGDFRPGLSVYDHLKTNLNKLCNILDADGAALLYGDNFTFTGISLNFAATKNLIDGLKTNNLGKLISSDNINEFYETQSETDPGIAGYLSVSLEGGSDNYIIFFRAPETQRIHWAGNKEKPVAFTDKESRLHPRSSFKEWIETHEGFAKPWDEIDIDVAEALRLSVLEIAIQNSQIAASKAARANIDSNPIVLELKHRLRNVFSLVKAIIRNSDPNEQSVSSYKTRLENRIDSIASAHTNLTGHICEPVELESIIHGEVKDYRQETTTLKPPAGGTILIQPDSVHLLTMFFHELVTNCIRHGNLAGNKVQLSVSWHLDAAGNLNIEWREAHERPLQKPTDSGFGSILIEQIVPQQLNGKTRVDYRENLLTVTLTVDPEHFTISNPETGISRVAQKKHRNAEVKASSLPFSSVLIVEDELLQAQLIQDELTKLGITSVYIAGSVNDAINLSKTTKPDLAILDVSLSLIHI